MLQTQDSDHEVRPLILISPHVRASLLAELCLVENRSFAKAMRWKASWLEHQGCFPFSHPAIAHDYRPEIAMKESLG